MSQGEKSNLGNERGTEILWKELEKCNLNPTQSNEDTTAENANVNDADSRHINEDGPSTSQPLSEPNEVPNWIKQSGNTSLTDEYCVGTFMDFIKSTDGGENAMNAHSWSAAYLNRALCGFLESEQQSKGTAFRIDRFYYIVLGLQKYLHDVGSSINILYDEAFHEYNEQFGRLAHQFACSDVSIDQPIVATYITWE